MGPICHRSSCLIGLERARNFVGASALALVNVHIHDYVLYLPFSLYADPLCFMTYGLNFARH